MAGKTGLCEVNENSSGNYNKAATEIQYSMKRGTVMSKNLIVYYSLDILPVAKARGFPSD